MQWIDEILEGLIDHCQTENIYELYDQLDIEIQRLTKDNIILKGNEAVYHRFHSLEIVYIEDNLVNEKFVLAHELAHAILHINESIVYFNPLENNWKLEKEANYFAMKLLYKDYEIEDGIETKSQLADRLGVNECYIEYIISK